MIEVQFPGGAVKEVLFLFTTASRPALRPTQPSVQWVPGVVTPEVKTPRREADHSHIVLRLRMRGSISQLNELCLWTLSIVWCLKNKNINNLYTKDKT
jgi:hypothetical protein